MSHESVDPYWLSLGRDASGKYTGNKQKMDCDQQSETQESIGKWNVETFGSGNDPKLQVLRLLAEVAELCKASGSSEADCMKAIEKPYIGMAPYDSLADIAAIPHEAADVFIVLNALAHRSGFSLERAVREKMAVNRQRKWRIDGNGVGQHVKEGE